MEAVVFLVVREFFFVFYLFGLRVFVYVRLFRVVGDYWFSFWFRFGDYLFRSVLSGVLLSGDYEFLFRRSWC